MLGLMSALKEVIPDKSWEKPRTSVFEENRLENDAQVCTRNMDGCRD